MRHALKILPEYFYSVRHGEKTSEIRFDDRGYSQGDVLVLKEWKSKAKRFTGREIEVRVVGITRLIHPIPTLSYLPSGEKWVVLHFVPTSSASCRFVMPEERASRM